MRTLKLLAASALATGMELASFASFSQPPANPPNPTPRQNPTPQPTPQTPKAQPPAQLPTPNVPTRIDPNNPNPNNANPNNPSNPNPKNPNANAPNANNPNAVARANRPFAFQSPEMEARFNENTRRLVQFEQRLEQSNQQLLKRLGEARNLTGDRQNAAFMDVIQQLLQNNVDMQRYLVLARMGWTGSPDDMTQDPNNQQPQTAVPDNNNPPR